MKLHDWYKLNGRSELERIADVVNASPDYLSLVAREHRKASPKLANKIEAATNCEVTRYDLRPDIFGTAPDQQAA